MVFSLDGSSTGLTFCTATWQPAVSLFLLLLFCFCFDFLSRFFWACSFFLRSSSSSSRQNFSRSVIPKANSKLFLRDLRAIRKRRSHDCWPSLRRRWIL